MNTCLALLVLATPCAMQDKPADEQIRKWIAGLQSDDIVERDAAEQKLVAAGEAALPLLEKAQENAGADLKARLQGLCESIRRVDVPGTIERCLKTVTDGDKRDAKWREKLDADVARLLGKLRVAGIVREAHVQAASLEDAERPEWKPVSATGQCVRAKSVRVTGIEKSVVVCAGDYQATSTERCIIICGGNVRANGISDSILLVTGSVRATTVDRSVVVALGSFTSTQAKDAQVYAGEAVEGDEDGLSRLFQEGEDVRGGAKVVRVKGVRFRK